MAIGISLPLYPPYLPVFPFLSNPFPLAPFLPSLLLPVLCLQSTSPSLTPSLFTPLSYHIISPNQAYFALILKPILHISELLFRA